METLLSQGSAAPTWSTGAPIQTGDHRLAAADRPEDLLSAHIPLIETLIRSTARRHRLSKADEEEFSSTVWLRFVENDFGILRKFKRRSSLRTFLSVVIARQLLDYRISEWGKWRPSAEAKRLGADAVRLETLVVRDKVPFDRACERLTAADPALTRERLEAIRDLLPRRLDRMVPVAVDLDTLAAETRSPDDGVPTGDDGRPSRALAEAIARLDAQDRRLIKLRFFDRVSVADIARRDGLVQRRLYAQLERVLERLRRDLEMQGVTESGLLR